MRECSQKNVPRPPFFSKKALILRPFWQWVISGVRRSCQPADGRTPLKIPTGGALILAADRRPKILQYFWQVSKGKDGYVGWEVWTTWSLNERVQILSSETQKPGTDEFECFIIHSGWYSITTQHWTKIFFMHFLCKIPAGFFDFSDLSLVRESGTVKTHSVYRNISEKLGLGPQKWLWYVFGYNYGSL